MQRQKGQRPGRQEALPGGFLMRFRCADMADYRLLIVIPAAGSDVGQVPNFRLRAIRAHQQPGGQFAAITQLHPPAVLRQRLRRVQRRRAEQCNRR